MTSSTLFTSPFDASTTATDVLAGLDLEGLHVLVTGASSGLGAETAATLAAAGADVTLAVRNTAAGAETADAIARRTGRRAPSVIRLDLADRQSVSDVVAGWRGPLHVLIDNAGIVTAGLDRTHDGWELQFATNHLGHFALTSGLHRALALGADDRGEARVVSLSSTAHMRAGIDFGDIHFRHRAYDPQIAYAQSKTANSLFAVEATQRWADDGIFANAVNPGGIATGLQRHFTVQQKASLAAAEAAGIFAFKSIGQGAATSVLAAAWPGLRQTGGLYLDDCRQAYTVADDAELADHPHGVKQWALDREAASRLWAVSSRLLSA